MESLTLYHTGFSEIREPDIRVGRKNADFGQGFYLSADPEFSRRWARVRRGEDTWMNVYTLVLDGLAVRRLSRDTEWFDYIYHNRGGGEDAMAEYDVVIGPIANDTIYDTWGIVTSGLITREQAIRLLTIGPVYEQVVVKTERAAAQLRFVSARVLAPEEVADCRAIVRREEADFQAKFTETMEEMFQKG